MVQAKQLRLEAEPGREVSALLLLPPKPKYLLVLGHGAGAGMNHFFMANLADALAAVNVASLRYQFPYMEEDRHVPDRPPILTATVAAAVRAATKAAPKLPVFAGGKSMGGRMTSQAAAQGLLPDVRGLVFFGFPLHQPNRPDTKRADHLADVKIPMLFLQGTRDTLADLTLLRPIVKKLGKRATLKIIPTADHSFHVLKSTKKSDQEILQELAATTAAWMKKLAKRLTFPITPRIFRITFRNSESKMLGSHPVMFLPTNLANAHNNFRQSIGRLILRFAPRYGSLDTIFHSYDDWRELQEQRPADATTDPPPQDNPATAARPQRRAQRGPKPRHAFE